MTDTRDPFAPFEVVAVNAAGRDPAVVMDDLEGPPDATPHPSADARLARYRDSLDRRELVLNGEPVLFVCKPMSPSHVVNFDDVAYTRRMSLCFLAGCHEIRVPGEAPLRAAKVKLGSSGVALAPDAWLDAVATRYGLETVYEVGFAVYHVSKLPAAKRGPFC